MLDKRFIKFHEIEQNRYYLLPFDGDIYIGTESFVPFEKKFLFFKKVEKITQGLKLLQLTGPISILFNSILNMEVDKEDKEFPDMTTYKKIDNVELRKNIEKTYKDSLDDVIKQMREDFEIWKENFILDSKDYNDEELDNIVKTSEERLEENIRIIKGANVINTLEFKWKTGDNTIIKKMLDNNMEMLYAQKIGSGYKIYYLYDLDIFGTLTLYKVQCVKNVVKSMETFIYNKEIIEEMIACMANNNL